jgi:hypothetical protein
MLNSQNRLYTLSGHVFLEIFLHCYTINLNFASLKLKEALETHCTLQNNEGLRMGQRQTPTAIERRHTQKKTCCKS